MARRRCSLSSSLVVAACSSSNNKTGASGSRGSGAGGSSGSSAACKVDTSNCPPEATQKISGTIKIGTTMPLSGGPAAAAFSPVAAGLEGLHQRGQRPEQLVPGYKLEIDVEDDQFNATLTTPAVDKLMRPDRREPYVWHDRDGQRSGRARHAQRRMHTAAVQQQR